MVRATSDKKNAVIRSRTRTSAEQRQDLRLRAATDPDVKRTRAKTLAANPEYNRKAESGSAIQRRSDG